MRKKKFLAKRFAHAISARVHYRDLEYAYVTEFDLRGSASYVIISFKVVGSCTITIQNFAPELLSNFLAMILVIVMNAIS